MKIKRNINISYLSSLKEALELEYQFLKEAKYSIYDLSATAEIREKQKKSLQIATNLPAIIEQLKICLLPETLQSVQPILEAYLKQISENYFEDTVNLVLGHKFELKLVENAIRFIKKIHAKNDNYNNLWQSLLNALQTYEDSAFSRINFFGLRKISSQRLSSIAEIKKLGKEIIDSKLTPREKYTALGGLIIREINKTEDDHHKNLKIKPTTSLFAKNLMEVLRTFQMDPSDKSYITSFNHFPTIREAEISPILKNVKLATPLIRIVTDYDSSYDSSQMPHLVLKK